MGIKGEKKKISPPPKTATKPGIRSVSLTMGLENTNVADVLRNNPHPKIIEWLHNKNLGKNYDVTRFDKLLYNKIDID